MSEIPLSNQFSAGQRRYAAEVSRHNEPAAAVGEVVGTVVEQIGFAPDVAVLLVSGPAVGWMTEIVDATRSLLYPKTLLAAAVDVVVAGGSGSESGSAVALWAGNPGEVQPLRNGVGTPTAMPDGRRATSGASEFQVTFGAHQIVEMEAEPGVLVRTIPGHRLWLDDREYQDGTVGFALPGSGVEVVDIYGMRPIGDPMAVTGVDGERILRLASRAAKVSLTECIDALSQADRELAKKGLFVGIVSDEESTIQRSFNFGFRKIQGATGSGSIVLSRQPNELTGGPATLGDVVQFHLSDPEGVPLEVSEFLMDDQPENPKGVMLVFVEECVGSLSISPVFAGLHALLGSCGEANSGHAVSASGLGAQPSVASNETANTAGPAALVIFR